MPHATPRRAAVPVFRRTGALLGRRFLLLEHHGPLEHHSTGYGYGTGHGYTTATAAGIGYVLLGVVHREPGALMVIAGHGPNTRWYRDIVADPGVRIWSGGIRHARANAVPLRPDHGTAILERYRHHHPLAARLLGRVLGIPEFVAGRPVPVRRAEELPLVRISPVRPAVRVN